MTGLYRHICEVCDKTEVLTSDEGFDAGWDYPPRMGQFGVIGPRTCGSCTIDKTLWWRVTQDESYELTEADQVLVDRIAEEPESILVDSGEA